MASPHDHPRKATKQKGSKDHVDVQLKVELVSSPGVPDDAGLAAHVFDENGEAVCHCMFERRRAKLHLPRRLAGRVVTIAVAAERKTEGEPTLPGIQARGAHVVRTPLVGGRPAARLLSAVPARRL